MARPGGVADEIEGQDEEFLFHLSRGQDLLSRGDADAAHASLSRALVLRPRDAKALGLAGQALYRQGRYDDAAEAWARLVDDNPVEPAARVNLGLARLKARRYPEAVKQLEIALDLNPEHKKAMGYLGLALLEGGDARRAREWFHRAGSDQLVARCDEVLLQSEAAAPAEDAPPAAFAGGAGAPPDGGLEAGVAAPDAGSAFAQPMDRGDPAHPAPVVEEPPPTPEPLVTPIPGALFTVRPPAAQGGLAAWFADRVLEVGAGPTFAVSGEVVAVDVRGEARVRVDGLFAVRGHVDLVPEVRRFRGRATDQPFGDGPARLHRAVGAGALFLRGGGRRFVAVDLGPEAVYLREEALFGFDDGISFENGRVPAEGGGEDLRLVHLRGQGGVLLLTAGEPAALDATPASPVRVPVRALLGWQGALTPRLAPLGAEGGPAFVELQGEGRVLVDPAALGQPAAPAGPPAAGPGAP